MTQPQGPEDWIWCDVCAKEHICDPREPWDVKTVKKPVYTCKPCLEAVEHAREQKRYLDEYHKTKK